MSRNLKAEEELLGEEGGKFSRQRTSEYSMSKELKGSQCAWDAESKGKRGAGNRGKWRLHCEALTWHRKRHKINVNFPSLDFPSSLISKDLEKSWKKKIILFCWKCSVNLIRYPRIPHERENILLVLRVLLKKGKSSGIQSPELKHPSAEQKIPSMTFILFWKVIVCKKCHQVNGQREERASGRYQLQ